MQYLKPYEHEQALRDLYRRLGFISRYDIPTALHVACCYSSRCWQGVGQRPNSPESGAYFPWVGRFYSTTRLFVLGHNMNEAGGLYVYYDHDVAAREELRIRNRLTYGNPDYPGSVYDRGMLACAWAILMRLGIGPFTDLTEIVSAAGSVNDAGRPQFVDGYDWLATTNVTKCGPPNSDRRNAGQPTPEMDARCWGHALLPELRILRPTVVLTLGQAAVTAFSLARKADPALLAVRHVHAHHPAQGFSVPTALEDLWQQMIGWP